jgi:hypothetical protein
MVFGESNVAIIDISTKRLITTTAPHDFRIAGNYGKAVSNFSEQYKGEFSTPHGYSRNLYQK